MAAGWVIAVVSIGCFLMVFPQIVPQMGLAWRPFYAGDAPGSTIHQQPAWACYLLWHLGFLMLMGPQLYTALESDQHGEQLYNKTGAYVVLFGSSVMIMLAHLVVGIQANHEKVKAYALQRDMLEHGSPYRKHVSYILCIEVIAMFGYAFLGCMAELAHKHEYMGLTLFGYGFILPLAEYGLVRYRLKMFDQYHTTASGKKSTSAIVYIASIGYVFGFGVAAWSVSTST